MKFFEIIDNSNWENISGELDDGDFTNKEMS